ncbi:multiple inositol polyphosphate phosphatase 1-like [Mercenaria mercenaria]|uniref:multiple inositol polyphosphate phosphatase 1-like n=1 Tax=Mercenaria mercenaria TaxID=6596 RepID=UPI00234F9C50|nr:multiple inositol polyphosphate phosphatase 1-like [Mercenaria mercenaria]
MSSFVVLLISHFWLISCIYGITRWDVFSTKTNYKWSHFSSATTDDGFMFSTGSKTCNAIHVSMVSRHGARWPSDGDMEDIKELHRNIIESKPSTVYPELDSWIPRYNESDEKQLTTEGKKEQEDLGARLGIRFKTLFNNNGKNVKFVSSSKSRTKDSNEYFHKGLSAGVQSVIEYTNEVNDGIVRPYDDCDNYEETVESDENMKEFNKFSKSSVLVNIIDSVKEKLGISFDVSDDDITIINELCAHEKAIFNEDAVWCNLLTDEERRILEYRSDIENYYEASYGHQINTKISCPLIGDMFHTMDNAINNPWNYSNVAAHGYLAGKFYNGHSETLLPLMTSLELFKDNASLLSTNMAAMANRKFKTSIIDPSSANLAFVLYVCNDSDTTDRSFMVKLFVNEKPVSIPACRGDMCTYETVRQYYSDLIDKCDLEAICDDDICDDDDATCRASGMDTSLAILLLLVLFCKIL